MKKQFYLLAISALSITVLLTYFLRADKFGLQDRDETSEQFNPPGYDHPDLAQIFETQRTKDPALGYPPVERLKDSYSYAKSILSGRRAVDNVNWTERGPNNFGGRTRALMFDPNDPTKKKVWAAGVTGGIWMNEDITDASVSWTKVSDFLGSLAVNNIVYDPNNTEVFYCGTGEGWFGGGMIRGNGIYKSTNAGADWVALESTDDSEFHFVQKLVVTSESTILAATRGTESGGGIYRSADGGTSWTKVVTEFRGADIEVVGNVIYASTGIFTAGKLWKSTDDGLTWEDITPSGTAERIEIGVHPNHSNLVYAAASNNTDVSWLKRSDDAGVTWKNLTIPKYLNSGSCTASSSDFARGQAWYDLIIGVHPEDPDAIVVGGIDLHRSLDGGTSWEPISYWTSACEIYVHADQHNFVYRPGYPNQALASNDGGVFYVEDILVPKSQGGPVFESRNRDYNVTQFYACAARNEAGSNNFLAGAQDNGSHRFTDRGVNSTFEVTGGDGAFCFIDQNQGDIQITSYVYNAYYVTTDNWQTYSGFGTGDKGEFINPTDYNSNTKTLFAASDDDRILRYANIDEEDIQEENLTLDLGATAISAVTVSPYDDDVLFVGAGGSIYRIDDVNAPTPLATDISGVDFPDGGFINNVAVGGSNDQLIIVFSNYGLVSVWETLDGGSTWSSKEGNLPDIPIRWAIYNPNSLSEVLVATDLGIWSTNDITATSPEWTPSNDGLANVRCDMIKFRDSDGLLIVATHGRGLYTSDAFATQALADFYIPQVVAYAGELVEFKNASIQADNYLWQFGDGTTSDQSSPEHSFTDPGIYDVTLTINGDISTSQSITVISKLQVDFDLADGGDFESATDLFSAYTKAGTGFSLGNSAVAGKDGTNSGTNAWVLGLNQATYSAYTEAYLYTPMYDFSLSGTYGLEFYTKYQIEDEWDGFILEYTLDQGTTWKKLGDYLDSETWYNQIAIDQASVFAPGKPFFSGDTGGQFVKKSINLDFLSNNETVAFRFLFKSDPAAEEAGLVIDDFTISGPTSEAPNLVFSVDNENPCINEVVILSNQSSGAITSYSWDFGDDAIPPSALGYGPHEVVYTAMGTKTVTLVGSTGSGEVTEETLVQVGGKPNERVPYSNDIQLCDFEQGVITIDDSEVGVSYQLYDRKKGAFVGDPISGSGSSLSLPSEELAVGSHEFEVWASLEGGCDIVLRPSIVFTAVKTPELTLELSDFSLSSSYKGADSYVWYLDGVVIEGASSDLYLASEPGTYQVEIERSGCTVLSEEVEIEILGTDSSLTGVMVFPNPVESVLTVNMDIASDYDLILFDTSGKVYLKKRFIYKSSLELDLKSLETGIYYLNVTSGRGNTIRKIIKL